MSTLQILCAARNAARFLPDCLASVQGQTHRDWRLHVRDDGSSDTTAQVVLDAAAGDPRIRLAQRSPSGSGVAGAYEALLHSLPDSESPVAYIDADDVWAPEHLQRSLEVLRHAERERQGPVLVHGDLAIVEADLRPRGASLWEMVAIHPDANSVQRIAVANVVTTSSMLMNGALAAVIRSRPMEHAVFHDWWCALAAAATGRIVRRETITVRYRQHGNNAVGAAPLGRLSFADLRRAFTNRQRFREDLRRTAAQAGAFASAFRDALTPDEHAFLERLAAIPARPWPLRAWEVYRVADRPGRTPLLALGEALRA